MRFMLKVNIPVEDGNEAVRKGTLGKTISEILSDIKPERFQKLQNHGSLLSMQKLKFIRLCVLKIWKKLDLIFKMPPKNINLVLP